MPTDPKTTADGAEALGFVAAARGEQEKANPYPADHPHHGAWLVGWIIAKARGAFLVTVREPTDADRAEFAAMLEDTDAD